MSRGHYASHIGGVGLHVCKFDGIPRNMRGFARVPCSSHAWSQDAVAVHSRVPCRYIRARSSALHLVATSTSPHPPSVLFHWSVGTLNVAPFHMKKVAPGISHWVWMPGAGNIWAMYHILANKYVWM